jgi:hypothetical protein
VLRPGGHVLLELAEHQAAAAADVVAGAGLVDVVLGWDRAEDDEDEVTFIEAVRAPA